MLMKFFRDLDIFILSMLRCPVRMLKGFRNSCMLKNLPVQSPQECVISWTTFPKQGEYYKQRTCMEEVVDPLRLALALCVFFMEERLCLCQLILVVRECQVNAPCVYVYARVK